MLFNSYEFFIFLPIVFGIYWGLQNRLRLQNIFLIAASYVFYGWWDWRFLSLIIFSSAVDFIAGRKLHASEDDKIRRRWLLLSVLVNLGFLGVFKYFNFFADSMVTLLNSMGANADPITLQVILPVGISFYTFQTMSYSIDIYRRKFEPTNDIVAFFAFVSFFPQLVAGPIERASHLLSQFYTPRKFDLELASEGARQMLWGLFVKVVVADGVAPIVDHIFENHTSLSGASLFLGSVLFAFQIYGDFSGYSLIAIGLSKILGFDLMQNFRYPYFADNIAEFWHRWHISLSTWFRDYVYIPLGGNRSGRGGHIRNVLITFVLSGLWHGANWTFLAWGLIHGLLYVPFILIDTSKWKFLTLPAARPLKVITLFTVVCLAWVFFRAENIAHAFAYISGIFSGSWSEIDFFTGRQKELLPYLSRTLVGLPLMLTFEFIFREREFGLAVGRWPVWARWFLYFFFTAIVLNYFGESKTFIYFQF